MRLVKGIIASTLSIGLLAGCGISEEDQAKIDKYDELEKKYEDLKEKYEKVSGESEEVTEKSSETNKNPKIGEYFEVEYAEYGEEAAPLGVKVVSVAETDQRGAGEESIEHVALVEFEFTNKTGDSIELSSSDFNVVDTEGFQGKAFSEGYSDIKGDLWVDLPKDGKARAYFRYEVGTPGPYSVQVGEVVVKQ